MPITSNYRHLPALPFSASQDCLKQNPSSKISKLPGAIAALTAATSLMYLFSPRKEAPPPYQQKTPTQNQFSNAQDEFYRLRGKFYQYARTATQTSDCQETITHIKKWVSRSLDSVCDEDLPCIQDRLNELKAEFNALQFICAANINNINFIK